MKAVVIEGDRSSPVLVWKDDADPVPQADEVLVRVRAAGVNRADLLQARGAYPPPEGASPILGLEIAGQVEQTGERVCALVPGGGYAERAAVHREMLLPLPPHWSFLDGAAVPEAWLTAFVNLFLEGGLRAGETVLIHAGASGVGTAAIQLARDAGARVFTTVGSEAKAEFCRGLGAELAVNRHEGDFAPLLLEATARRGVDLILDCVGGAYLRSNIQVLAPFGRLVSIGLLGGARGELDMAALLRRRLRLIGSTLRSRPRQEQIAITRAFRERYWEKLTAGALRIVRDRSFPITQAQQAHAYVAANANIGKVVLEIP